MKTVAKILLIIAGSISLGLGVLGIFIPGLPVTPFMLLSAWLFFRSSQTLYNKLLNNRFLGKYIRNYRKNKGMTLKIKLWSIFLMWAMISISTIFMIEEMPIKLIVITVGLIGTIVMGFIIKTVKPED